MLAARNAHVLLLLLLNLAWRCFGAGCKTAAKQHLSSLLAVKEGDQLGDCGLHDELARVAIENPQVTKLMINIGSNVDPVVAHSAHKDVVSVAMEPVVPHLIRAYTYPRLLIVPAAVSARDGTATMHLYGRSERFVGSSSSLSKPAVSMPGVVAMGQADNGTAGFAAETRHALASKKLMARSSTRTVPLISMRAVLAAIPPTMKLLYLKTDMQGHDFEAISSVGANLTRAQYVKNEVDFPAWPWQPGKFKQSAADVRNDFCLDHWPHMTRLGFRFLQLAEGKNILLHSAQAAQAFCNLGAMDPRPPAFAPYSIGGNLDAYWISPLCDTPRPPAPSDEWPTFLGLFEGKPCEMHPAEEGRPVQWVSDKVREKLFWGAHHTRSSRHRPKQ